MARPSLEDRFVFGVDVQKYSARSTRLQLGLQSDLRNLLDEAADNVGLNRELWDRQPGGDGEVAVLPHRTDLVTMVRRFVLELDALLTDHNEDHGPEARMRLRLAMHIDPVSPGEFGAAGPALVVLSRLLDSAPVREALVRQPEAGLALIISEPVYTKTVLSELGGLRPAQFSPVQVEVKDFRQTAYVFVPGGAPARPAEPGPPPPAAPPGGSATYIISDSVHVGGDLFGGSKGGPR